MSALRLGPLLLPWWPVLLLGGWAVALGLGSRLRAGRGAVQDAMFPLLLLGLAGARAGFALRHAGAWDGWLALFDLRDGGLDPGAGVLVGLAGLGFWCWRRPALRRGLLTSALGGLLAGGAGFALLQLAQPVPPPLPALLLNDLDGRPVALASLRGRPLVLNLWATWCPPCRHELPLLAAAARQPGAARIVLVNEGEDATRVAAFLHEQQLRFPELLLDPQLAVSAHYQTQGYPTTLFIDSTGTLRDTHVGELSRATLAQGIAALP
jgi:thiol-disulfide isomerase/thioredoxin